MILRALPALLFALAALAADAPPPADPPVPAGARVVMAATADGNPAPTFEWYRNGAKIGDGATYTIQSMSEDHAGSYTVRATNYLGSAVSPPHVLALGGVLPGNVRVSITVTVTTTLPPSSPP
jgi:hypothetical protein